MQKHIRWLLAEIDRWVADGVVTAEQAGRLRSRYGDTAPVVPWGLIVFATAGAVVVGLGVILLFAYNWDAIPKPGKLALIFGAIVAAHAGAIKLLAGDGWKPKLGEALSVLGTMFYGAGIWLVAQVYNIDEHYPNGFLFWALGALAMAWALRSTANGLLAAVLLVVWGTSESFGFHNPDLWSLLLLAGALLPLAWLNRSALLLAATLVAILFITITGVSIWGALGHGFTSCLAIAILLVALARSAAAAGIGFEPGVRVMEFLGLVAFVVCGYLLSFHGAVDDLLDWSRNLGPDEYAAAVFSWLLFAAALAAWGLFGWRALRLRDTKYNLEDWLLPVAAIHSYIAAVNGDRDWIELVALTMNLVLLGIAAMWMWRGCRESRLGPTVARSCLPGSSTCSTARPRAASPSSSSEASSLPRHSTTGRSSATREVSREDPFRDRRCGAAGHPARLHGGAARVDRAVRNAAHAQDRAGRSERPDARSLCPVQL